MTSPGSPSTSPPALDAELTDVTEDFGTLSLMGPRARDVLARGHRRRCFQRRLPLRPCPRDRRSPARRPRPARHLCRRTRLGAAHADRRHRRRVRRADGGRRAARHRARVGYRALESLRLEKGYRAWGTDITPNDTRSRPGLGWAVKLNLGRAFLGRDALVAKRKAAARAQRLRPSPSTIRTSFCSAARPSCANGEPVGYLTSGG